MKFPGTFAVALLLLSTLVFTAPAQAATVTDCQAQIEALRVQTR